MIKAKIKSVCKLIKYFNHFMKKQNISIKKIKYSFNTLNQYLFIILSLTRTFIQKNYEMIEFLQKKVIIKGKF